MNISSVITGYIKESNVKLDKTAQQVSTGLKDSLTTLEYGRKLKLDDDIHDFQKVNENLNIAKSQNQVSDSVMAEMKDIINSFKAKTMIANTATTDNPARDVIATELKDFKDAIIDMANTQVMDQHIFSGATKWEKPFNTTRDQNGNYINTTYNGSAKKFEQVVDLEYEMKGQGITGLELFDGLVANNQHGIFNENGELLDISNGGIADKYYIEDASNLGSYLDITYANHSFLQGKTVYPDDGAGSPNTANAIVVNDLKPLLVNGKTALFDGLGNLVEANNGGLSNKYYKEDQANPGSYIEINTTTEKYDDLKGLTIYLEDANNLGNPNMTIPISIDNDLQPKILYELDEVIRAVDNNIVGNDSINKSIGKRLNNLDEDVFSKLNIQHANLGSSNAMFEQIIENNDIKILNLEITLKDTIEVDVAEQAMKMKQLELMFAAMFSTLQQVSKIDEELIRSI